MVLSIVSRLHVLLGILLAVQCAWSVDRNAKLAAQQQHVTLVLSGSAMEQDNAQLNAVMEQEKTMNSVTMAILIQVMGVDPLAN